MRRAAAATGRGLASEPIVCHAVLNLLKPALTVVVDFFASFALNALKRGCKGHGLDPNLLVYGFNRNQMAVDEGAQHMLFGVDDAVAWKRSRIVPPLHL